ncbi:long-chain-acyl-CoA synthetase [Candidatus Binatus sp.]|uniref:long-chain-acyl-CoA synthetase n=1 Tax=Candidatus Binatus sp. TaxID=2811406 RepID=UPI003BB05403
MKSNIGQEAGRDSSLKAWVRALEMTAPIAQNPANTLPVLIDSLAERFGTAPAILSRNENLTYRELADRSKRYAKWALRQGLSFGDVVCLLMPNCPDYIAIWLGITRVGGIVSLLNTNLVGDSLAHAINIVEPKRIIVSAALVEAFAAVVPKLPPEIQNWAHGENSLGFSRIDREIEPQAGDDLAGSGYRLPTIADRALYIYTSGTTGLPKAVNVSHFRVMQWSHWFAGMMDTGPDDRVYNCLPMYHSVGGVVAIGAALVNGGSVVLRERFSASSFWDDIVESRCTIFQYIGELCRYLVNSPPRPLEGQHQLRLACGNGLGADVWERFQSRFHIPQILEFYAATEGNFSLYNCEGRVGAIGRIPSFLRQRSSIALVRFDFESGEPIRNADGFCIRCSSNEAGEAIGQILDDGTSSASRFEGYADKAATEKKILRNVFTPGDAWFRTGDLMRRDESGFFYFVDRIGDTFRWKGENVSTTEVAAAVCAYPGVVEAVVYGVKIPGSEGRAGMVAAVVREGFDLNGFRQHLVERLPDYACPLFLRILAKIEATGTFKPNKQDLARESYNPSATADPIYVNDPLRMGFVKVDAEFYERIQRGNMRL